MEPDSWVGIFLLILAAALLSVVAAAEAGVVSISRARARALAARGAQPDALHAYIEERHLVMGALSVARNLAVVLATSVGVFLVVRHIEGTWLALGLTMISALVALGLIEALPRLVVSRSPDRWTSRLSPLVDVLRAVFGVPPWLLRRLLAWARPPGPPQDTEEILRLVELEETGAPIEEEEREMIRGVIHLADRTVREIMVPRIDIVAVEVNASLDDVLRLITTRGYSRIPVYEDTIDNIVGVVYAKDLIRLLAQGTRAPIREVMRPPHFVPESKRVDELLAELRNSRVHIAIVVDEYGGTAGLVTIEDLLEEIVGEIQDEYDVEEATIERVAEDEAIVDARVSLDAVNELFDLDLESEDYDTIGGFVYHHLGKVPAPGDEFQADGLSLQVLSVAGRRIRKLRVRKLPAPPPANGRNGKNGGNGA